MHTKSHVEKRIKQIKRRTRRRYNTEEKITRNITILVVVLFSVLLPNDTLQIDLKQSQIEWIGRKVTGKHTGTLDLLEGWVLMDRNTPIRGRFIFDMTTLSNTDIEFPQWKLKLENHLKSNDFFYVDSFPQVILEINGNKSILEEDNSDFKHQIKADLTIRNITHEITIPYELVKSDGIFRAEGYVDVDRTLYNIQYKSGMFFHDLGDKLIDDNFTIQFKVYTQLTQTR